jgi:flagellar motor switch protein FliG
VDLVFLDDWVVRTLLVEVSITDIALSIRTANDTLKSKILGNLSEEAAARLAEMGEPGPVRIKDIEAARDRIVDALLLLAARGEVSIEGVVQV